MAPRRSASRCCSTFIFHGQYAYGAFKTDAADFAKLGAESGFITVAPKGMADGGPSASVAGTGRLQRWQH